MDRCVVRKSIKDAINDQIIGYELMFENDNEGLFNSPEANTADTMAGFLMQNNEKIFNEKLTFVTVTPSLLFRNTPKIFEKDRIVIQIEDSLLTHPLSAPIIKKYYEEGYNFAINNFIFKPNYFSVLEYIAYIKVEIKGKEKDSLDNIIKMMKGFNKKCIITGIDSKDEYLLAKELGVDYLEGDYIAEDMIEKSNHMEFLEGNFYQLVVAVTKDEPDIEEIEEIISRDASLSFMIFKMVNSAYFALRQRVSSIRQAVVTLGIGQLKRWVYLMSFNEREENGTLEEVLKLSFLRATFASALVERVKDFTISKAEAYMMGMFSTLEYLIDAPIAEILNEIPITEEVKTALVAQEGQCGRLYELIINYEKADWKKIKKIAGELGISTNAIGQVYINCVEDVNQIWRELTSNFERVSDQ